MNLHRERLDLAAAWIRPLFECFLDRSLAAGFKLLVVRCYSSPVEQLAIYGKGREFDRASGTWIDKDKGAIVTNALPGKSSHEVVTLDGKAASLGMDVIPVDGQGQPIWNTPRPVWQALYAISSRCGLDSYGDGWGAEKAGDPGHFQAPGFHCDRYKETLLALGLRMPSAPELWSL